MARTSKRVEGGIEKLGGVEGLLGSSREVMLTIMNFLFLTSQW